MSQNDVCGEPTWRVKFDSDDFAEVDLTEPEVTAALQEYVKYKDRYNLDPHIYYDDNVLRSTWSLCFIPCTLACSQHLAYMCTCIRTHICTCMSVCFVYIWHACIRAYCDTRGNNYVCMVYLYMYVYARAFKYADVHMCVAQLVKQS